MCTRFELVGSPGTCENAATETDHSWINQSIIWVIAAFPDSASPAVSRIDFGLRNNLPMYEAGYFPLFGFCGPNGTTESSTDGWPYLGGTTIHYGSVISEDRFFPVYYASAYGFPGAYVGTGIHPSLGYAAFWDDGQPPVFDKCERFGQVRWYEEGYVICPATKAFEAPACCFPDGHCELLSTDLCTAQGGDPKPPGTECGDDCPVTGEACCFPDYHCEVVTETSCINRGGEPHGTGSICAVDTCPIVPQGACCVDDLCNDFMTRAMCATLSGTYFGNGTTCTTGLCTTPQACCFPDQHCELQAPEACTDVGGVPAGAGSVCESDPCALASAADALAPPFSVEVSPNPFSIGCKIAHPNASVGRISIEIFDPLGRMVRRLLDDAHAGDGQITTWDGTDDRGNLLPTGLYVIRVSTASGIKTARVTVLR